MVFSTFSVAREIWHFVRLVLVAYLLLVLLMLMFEESFIFFPATYPAGDWQPAGLTFEDVEIDSADGTKLHGWFLPHAHPRAVVLFLHGNAGNVTHRAEVLHQLHRLGVAVLIFDYRGYGKSEGKPTESGIIADANSARRWLAERAKLDQDQIVLMGESLGGAVAAILAATAPARALILENTFSSAPDVAAFHYPWVPTRLMRTKLNAVEAIVNHRGPLLQFHGESDTIIPIELGQRLFEAANEPKRFVVVPGADHNDPRTSQVVEELDHFLDQLPPP